MRIFTYLLLFLFASGVATAADPEKNLLEETVDFNGAIMYYSAAPPGLIIAAVSGDNAIINGYGETTVGSGIVPDGKSIFGVGSISKVFAGHVLAASAEKGTVALSAPLARYLPEDFILPQVEGTDIRLIDLVTHTAGLPRELPIDVAEGVDPLTARILPAYRDYLSNEALLFRPGSAALYSNFGFEMLGAALGNANNSTYGQALKAQVSAPLKMADTGWQFSADQKSRLMTSYFFDGSPLEPVKPSDLVGASGGVFSTADDMVKWMRWNLAKGGDDAETRLRFHAMYRPRDGLTTVGGLDGTTKMDAMGLGWVATLPHDNYPFVLQKTGALNGFMAYVVLAPARGKAVFFVFNKFDFSMYGGLTKMANSLLAAIPDGTPTSN